METSGPSQKALYLLNYEALKQNTLRKPIPKFDALDRNGFISRKESLGLPYIVANINERISVVALNSDSYNAWRQSLKYTVPDPIQVPYSHVDGENIIFQKSFADKILNQEKLADFFSSPGETRHPALQKIGDSSQSVIDQGNSWKIFIGDIPQHILNVEEDAQRRTVQMQGRGCNPRVFLQAVAVAPAARESMSTQVSAGISGHFARSVDSLEQRAGESPDLYRERMKVGARSALGAARMGASCIVEIDGRPENLGFEGHRSHAMDKAWRSGDSTFYQEISAHLHDLERAKDRSYYAEGAEPTR